MSGGASRRGPRTEREVPWSGSGRARPVRPQRAAGDGDRAAEDGPAIPAGVDARQLAPEIRRELSTLDRVTADAVARHLVAAGELLDRKSVV